MSRWRGVGSGCGDGGGEAVYFGSERSNDDWRCEIKN
jgi:hypothetical protein